MSGGISTAMALAKIVRNIAHVRSRSREPGIPSAEGDRRFDSVLAMIADLGDVLDI